MREKRSKSSQEYLVHETIVSQPGQRGVLITYMRIYMHIYMSKYGDNAGSKRQEAETDPRRPQWAMGWPRRVRASEKKREAEGAEWEEKGKREGR